MIEKSNTSIGRNSAEDGVVDLGHISIGNTGFACPRWQASLLSIPTC